EHDHGLCPCRAAVLWRLVPMGRPSRPCLLLEDRAVSLPLHLAPRHLPAPSLRHAHASGLEGAAAAGNREHHRHRDRADRGAVLGMTERNEDGADPTPLRLPGEGVPPKPEGPKTSAMDDVAALAGGVRSTLQEFFRPSVTTEYPEEKTPRSERYRGRHYLRRYDNGLERCIGCELCAAACPVGCILVIAAESTEEKRVSPGERFAKTY